MRDVGAPSPTSYSKEGGLKRNMDVGAPSPTGGLEESGEKENIFA